MKGDPLGRSTRAGEHGAGERSVGTRRRGLPWPRQGQIAAKKPASDVSHTDPYVNASTLRPDLPPGVPSGAWTVAATTLQGAAGAVPTYTCRGPREPGPHEAQRMITFSDDPRVAEQQMHAVIYYLTAFGYIDGDFDTNEKQYIRDHIGKLVEPGGD